MVKKYSRDVFIDCYTELDIEADVTSVLEYDS